MNSLQIAPPAPKPLFRLSVFSYGAIPTYIGRCIDKLTTPQKAICVSLGTGVLLVGLAARYFRRRRRKRAVRKSALASKDAAGKQRKNKPLIIRSPSGDFCVSGGGRSSPASSSYHRFNFRRSSVSAGSVTSSGVVVVPGGGGGGGELGEEPTSTKLTPQQYGVMGMEALEGAISLWEETLSSYAGSASPEGGGGGGGRVALPTQEEAEFTQALQKVIEDAYSLQDQCEHLFLHEHSVIFRSAEMSPDGSEAGEYGGGGGDRRRFTSFSSMESFVSCQGDIADLSHLEEFDEEAAPSLYLSALKHHEEVGIPYRDVRTDRVRVGSDVEYVCKVHCLRLASQCIFSHADTRQWFAQAGTHVIAAFLVQADKDPKDALFAYETLLSFLSECDWAEVESELRGRGVPATTFYDVVLDFILIDAFEDLENPPSSVYAVVQNRWLSNGFKESALATAVWSVLKAKRRMLKNQDGFIAHFYDVTEHLSPVLAWGFLGPDHRLRELCQFFKDQVECLLQEMFSFSAVRYTCVEELSEDLLRLTRHRYDLFIQKVESATLPQGTDAEGERPTL